MITCRTLSAVDWQGPFVAMLPAIERQARYLLSKLPRNEREEALQAIIAYAAVACAGLAERNRLELAYPTPLAHYGFKHYRAGRAVGGSVNSQDLTSMRRQRERGGPVAPLDDWQDSLVETRRTTPADTAAFRVDFGAWLGTLTPRDRKLAKDLARGEPTSGVASRFKLTAGRVSQLRRELWASWQRFLGEPLAAAK
jgi:hypothetical protein